MARFKYGRKIGEWVQMPKRFDLWRDKFVYQKSRPLTLILACFLNLSTQLKLNCYPLFSLFKRLNILVFPKYSSFQLDNQHMSQLKCHNKPSKFHIWTWKYLWTPAGMKSPVSSLTIWIYEESSHSRVVSSMQGRVIITCIPHTLCHLKGNLWSCLP